MPIFGGSAFSIGVFGTHFGGNAAENFKIITRIANGRNRRLHRHEIIIHWRHGDIGSLKRGGARQNNIGMFGKRVPTPFMRNGCVRLAPASQKPRQILVMVKRITASPIDHLDIGITIATAIIVKFITRMKKHISNAGNRDKRFNIIFALRHCGNRQTLDMIANRINRRIAKPKSTTRQTDLTKHGRKRNPRPKRLFPMRLPRQRPAE